uniref:C-type lectin domain-containing protein n=1 Tax=Acrobeloides nanus TaxID=290746 RepID=A0A914CTP4_9BILA
MFGANLLSNDHAEKECKKLGWHLASVHDTATNNLIGDQLKKIDNITNKLVWLGGFTMNACGADSCGTTWFWEDSTPFDFQAFAKGYNGSDDYQCTTFNITDNLWYAQYQEDGNNKDIKLPYLCKVPNPSFSTPKPTHSPCPNGSFPGIHLHDCFMFQQVSLKWHDAKDACFGHGGDLASIHDAFTNKLVFDFVKNYTSQNIWLGAKTSYGCSQFGGCGYNWEWDDKSDFEYSNFAAGAGNADTGISITLKNNNGLWNTTFVTEEHSFLCKVPPSS